MTVADVIQFPHAGSLTINLLNANLPDGLVAYNRVPNAAANPVPSEFIVVRVVGGLAETIVTSAAQITVDGYAAKDARAYQICDLALGIIRASDDLIRGARGFTYPQALPDPSTNQTRYTSTGEVRIWATPST